MKLAWQNIIHDRARFSVTVLGVCFAVFLMIFQGSLLAGFLRAASRLIDASDSDIWIASRGVQAFEFGTVLDSRVREMAAGIPGVVETGRVCMAFAVYRTPNGTQQVVALVGADPNVGKRFPVPNMAESEGATSPEAVLYDRLRARSGLVDAQTGDGDFRLLAVLREHIDVHVPGALAERRRQHPEARDRVLAR